VFQLSAVGNELRLTRPRSWYTMGWSARQRCNDLAKQWYSHLTLADMV